MDEFVKHVKSSGRQDVVIRKTGCTGRCSKEPIVGVSVPGQLPVKYERVNRELVHKIFTSHIQGGVPVAENALDDSLSEIHKSEFVFCAGVRCGLEGDNVMQDKFAQKLRERVPHHESVKVSKVGCFGACSQEDRGKCAYILHRPSKAMYRIHSEQDLDEIIESQVLGGKLVERLLATDQPVSKDFFDMYGDVAFFNRQSRVALRNSGVVDPESLDEYVTYGGFKALATVLGKRDPQWVINEVLKARLRGRGGGGFPTGKKWQMAFNQKETTRYLICNGDEGDPGAFMDRGMLESDPFNIVEGMIIGGLCHPGPEGLPLHPRRVSPGHQAHPERHRPEPGRGPAGQGHHGLGLRLRPGDPPGRRRLRLRRRDRPHRLHRGRARPARAPAPVSRRSAASGASPPASTTWRPSPTSPPSSTSAATGSPGSAPPRAAAPRSSPWPARSSTPAWWKCPWAPRSGTWSSISAAASRTICP